MDKKKIEIIVILIIILLLIIGLILFFMNKKYTVYFDSKCDIAVESQTVKRGERVKEPEEPTKEGYIFLGWYRSEESTERFDFNTPIKEDILLIAKWKQTEESKIVEISIEGEKSEITVDEELELILKITPEEVNKEEIKAIWTSSDDSIATVDENGKVKALKAGKVTITVKIGEFTASFEITVKEANTENKDISTDTNTSNKTNNTKKDTTTNNNSSSNNSSNNNNNNDNDVKPEPAPEPTPEPEITYTYEWVKIESSVAGEYYLYIVSSEGKHVAGTVTITTKAGKSSTVSIPASGAKYVKDAIASVSNVKAN